MPNYDYFCEQCERTMERIVSIAERDNQECDDCRDTLVRKITFTGTVWSPTATGASHR